MRVSELNAAFPCRVLDIGCKGARVRLEERLPKDQTLHMLLLFDGIFRINVSFWVVWSRETKRGNWYGIYFKPLRDDDKQELIRFLGAVLPDAAPERCPEEEEEIWVQKRQRGGTEMEDRRIFARLPVRLRARYLNLDDNAEAEATTIDVSAKGVGLQLAQQVPLNAKLELWLHVPDQGSPVYTRGEVVWCERRGAQYRCGIDLEHAELMGLSRLLRTRTAA